MTNERLRNRQIDKITEISKKLDWNVCYSQGCFSFETYSNCGQEFVVEVTLEEEEHNPLTLQFALREKLIEYYDNFDVDTETYMWLDNEGHGKNGAPYHMIDLWNDINNCHEKIWELASAFN